MILFFATILLVSAGRIDWLWGWLLAGIYAVSIIINAVIMFRVNPTTIAERANAAEMKSWDKVIGRGWGLMYFVVTPLVAGLDVRYGWTVSQTLGLHLAGMLGFILGWVLFSWAMISNAYFAMVARVQSDRGHTVCTRGPYRHVRHPGYLGAIIQCVGLPLLLGSLWALIPGGIAIIFMIVRTMWEDRMLQIELVGYLEYMEWVRYRLLPRVW